MNIRSKLAMVFAAGLLAACQIVSRSITTNGNRL